MLHRKRVIIIQRITAGYRIPFFCGLAEKLENCGVELKVLYGQPSKYEESQNVQPFSCGIQLRNRYYYMGRTFLVWQPVFQYMRQSDLVVLQQANRLLSNYALLSLKKLYGFRLAFWGHGRNFQSTDKNLLREKWKKVYSRHVDHWFAYNELSAEVMVKNGFPTERITNVQNTIDTRVTAQFLEEISESEQDNLRSDYGIPKTDPVGIVCTRLYHEKRLDFLVRCVDELRQRIPNFHCFVIGGGPDSHIIENYAHQHSSWFHYVGPKYGREKVLFFALAQFQLMPGPVGLHIIDSFSLLTPLVTTKIDTHGPESIYLENGFNGIMTENTVEAYVREIIGVIRDRFYQQQLVEGCRMAREQYTIENMVNNFAEGILHTLSS